MLIKPKPDRPLSAEAPDPEEELAESLLERQPEGRGPTHRDVRREVQILGRLSIVAFVVLAAILLLARPSYSAIVTISVLAIAYLFGAAPLFLAVALRLRDEVDANREAHEIVEESAINPKPGDAPSPRST